MTQLYRRVKAIDHSIVSIKLHGFHNIHMNEINFVLTDSSYESDLVYLVLSWALSTFKQFTWGNAIDVNFHTQMIRIDVIKFKWIDDFGLKSALIFLNTCDCISCIYFVFIILVAL